MYLYDIYGDNHRYPINSFIIYETTRCTGIPIYRLKGTCHIIIFKTVHVYGGVYLAR